MSTNENGAPILPDGNAPIAVNDSTPDVSIVPQNSLKNQDNQAVSSGNCIENTDVGADNQTAVAAGSGSNGNTGNVVAAPQKQAAPFYQENVRMIIKKSTETYIKHIHNGPITVLDILTKGIKISDDLLTCIQDRLGMANLQLSKDKKKYTIPSTLPPSVAVSIIMQTDAVRVLKLNADNYRIIIKHYNEDGSFSGIWELLPEYNKEGNYGILNSLMNELIGGDAPPHVMAQAVNALRSEMLNRQKNGNYVVEPGWDPDLVPFYNGVYNGRDKTFMEYNDPAYEATYGHMYWLNKMDTNFTWTPSRLPEFDPIEFIRSLFEDTMEHNLKFNRKLKKKFDQEYSKNEYPHYDNYDAIEVPIVEAVPSDYDGVMGVPITFFDKYNPDQFDVIGFWNTGTAGEAIGASYCDAISAGKQISWNGPTVHGQTKYFRILIRNKHPTKGAVMV